MLKPEFTPLQPIQTSTSALMSALLRPLQLALRDQREVLNRWPLLDPLAGQPKRGAAGTDGVDAQESAVDAPAGEVPEHSISPAPRQRQKPPAPASEGSPAQEAMAEPDPLNRPADPDRARLVPTRVRLSRMDGESRARPPGPAERRRLWPASSSSGVVDTTRSAASPTAPAAAVAPPAALPPSPSSPARASISEPVFSPPPGDIPTAARPIAPSPAAPHPVAPARVSEEFAATPATRQPLASSGGRPSPRADTPAPMALPLASPWPAGDALVPRVNSPAEATPRQGSFAAIGEAAWWQLPRLPEPSRAPMRSDASEGSRAWGDRVGSRGPWRDGAGPALNQDSSPEASATLQGWPAQPPTIPQPGAVPVTGLVLQHDATPAAVRTGLQRSDPLDPVQLEAALMRLLLASAQRHGVELEP